MPAMGPLPTGTLTLLFSDIEGSTSLLKGLGDHWGEALSAQRRILREAFTRHGGHEMGTEGDSFFVVFASAHDALGAAREGQRGLREHEWPGGLPIRVRMGLHTGEPERHEDGYIGLDVHRAARIAATAHGGQIVVSGSTQALVGAHGLRDLGWHRLKDLPEPEHLFDVDGEAFPPLRSLGTRANLPTYVTELIGRDAHIAELCEALRGGARLITLTGTGGTGKTRLAVATATELEGAVADIYFVALHTADRAALMWSAIAEVISAPGDAEQLPDERALAFLRDREALLVLDNLEQIDDADTVVGRLLDEAPRVRILATSRRPLHLVDERLHPVPALPVPDARAPLSEVETGAVALFVRRARMVKPSFRLTPANAGHIVALCRRLDGLPLAIELTAARTRLLSPEALLRRLDDWAGAVPVGGRDERQQTLHAAIAWSYDLLDPDDQRVFRQLGVFSSRFDLDAVGQVLGMQDSDPLDVVAHLVDVSLVEIMDGADGEPLLFLLETIRQFARLQLEGSEEHDTVRLEHARWCHAVATGISALLHSPRQMGALDRMQAIEEDVRAALDWCLAPGTDPAGERAAQGYALLEPMDAYWYRFGYIAEGRGWHERALALLAAGDIPDSIVVLDALHGHGVLALQQMDLQTGTQALERSLAIAHRLGDLDREARESNSLGVARREAGDIDGARRLIEQSLALARLIRDPHREATALSNVVHLHMDSGEYAEAVEAARRAIAADRALDDPWGVAVNQSNLVAALLHAEGPEPALAEFRRIAGDAVALGDRELSIDLLETAAGIWAGLGRPERAASLLGTAEEQRRIASMPRPAQNEQYLQRFLTRARQAVPEQAWEAALAHGRSLTIEQSLADALAYEVASGG